MCQAPAAVISKRPAPTFGKRSAPANGRSASPMAISRSADWRRCPDAEASRADVSTDTRSRFSRFRRLPRSRCSPESGKASAAHSVRPWLRSHPLVWTSCKTWMCRSTLARSLPRCRQMRSSRLPRRCYRAQFSIRTARRDFAGRGGLRVPGQTLTLIKAALFAFEVNYGIFATSCAGCSPGHRPRREQGEPLTGIEWFSDEWPIWRVIKAGLGTRGNRPILVALGDVRKANDLLDAYEAAETRMRAKERRK